MISVLLLFLLLVCVYRNVFLLKDLDTLSKFAIGTYDSHLFCSIKATQRCFSIHHLWFFFFKHPSDAAAVCLPRDCCCGWTKSAL